MSYFDWMLLKALVRGDWTLEFLCSFDMVFGCRRRINKKSKPPGDPPGGPPPGGLPPEVLLPEGDSDEDNSDTSSSHWSQLTSVTAPSAADFGRRPADVGRPTHTTILGGNVHILGGNVTIVNVNVQRKGNANFYWSSVSSATRPVIVSQGPAD